MLKIQDKEIAEVLVIEDDKVFSSLHAHMIRNSMAANPRIFDRARDAVEYLDSDENPEGFKLILLDLNMPGMSGWDFLEEISKKAYSSNILVVIVTSSLFWEDFKRSKDHEQVIAYFTKPLKKEELSELINRKNLCVKGKDINSNTPEGRYGL